MRLTPSIVACLILLPCAACSTSRPIIADKSFMISPSLHPTYEVIGAVALAGAAVWYIGEPMKPTWGVASRKITDNRYHIDLKQKRFAVGGDGEAWQVFHRAAGKLAEDNGFTGYTILTYTEGIESGPLISQRVSSGVVQLDGEIAASR